MNCNVVKDLLPLYVDGCCSSESAALVKEHLQECGACNAEYAQMKKTLAGEPVTVQELLPGSAMNKVNIWKASVLQMVLLFLSFGLITAGVAMEASIGSDNWVFNGFFGFNFVIPVTGFMLSLATWYFLPLYQNKKQFTKTAWLTTLGITVLAFLWGLFHYELNWFAVALEGNGIGDLAETVQVFFLYHGLGILITVALCFLSKTLSNRYANLLGKE